MAGTSSTEGQPRTVEETSDSEWKVEILKVEIVKGLRVETGQMGRAYEVTVLAADTKLLKLRIGEDDGDFLAGCRYELVIGEETFTGETDAEGVILQQVPREATRGELRFWVEVDDEEPQVWPIRIR